MDKKTLGDLQERLLEVNKVIAKLDSSIRVAAFDFFKPYILCGKVIVQTDLPKPPTDEAPSGEVAELIQQHGDGKPHENVNLLAAIWFGEHGSQPFSLSYLRDEASSTGLTIPAKPGMTLVQAKEKGKKLYGSAGRGLFKPTVVGEAFFKATYGVKKGTKAPPAEPK